MWPVRSGEHHTNKIQFHGIMGALAIMLWKIATRADDIIVMETNMWIIKCWNNNIVRLHSTMYGALFGIIKLIKNYQAILQYAESLQYCVTCDQIEFWGPFHEWFFHRISNLMVNWNGCKSILRYYNTTTFAHAMTTQLLCHMQNYIAATSL